MKILLSIDIQLVNVKQEWAGRMEREEENIEVMPPERNIRILRQAQVIDMDQM